MSPAAFAVLGLAVLAVVFGALAGIYWRRWKRAEAEAAAAGRRTARSEAALASAPLGCLVIAPGGARVHGQPALMTALGLGGQTEAALGAIEGAVGHVILDETAGAVVLGAGADKEGG